MVLRVVAPPCACPSADYCLEVTVSNLFELSSLHLSLPQGKPQATVITDVTLVPGRCRVEGFCT